MGSKGDRRREGIGKGGYETIRFEFYGPDTHRCPSDILAYFSLTASSIFDNYFQFLFYK